MYSLIIAFSMYSKLPMPQVSWTKERSRYVMCCFPFVGAVLSLISFAVCAMLDWVHAGILLKSAVLTLLPLFYTGGIHMDGFLDTVDAKSSYQSKERKLEILKDPHAGAFAIIWGVAITLFSFGCFSEITGKERTIVFLGYVLSRVLSAIAAVTFRGAKEGGTLAAFATASEKKVSLAVLGVVCLSTVSAMLVISPLAGGLVVLAAFSTFLYYRFMSYRIFGGITGDLAGWFVQVCESAMLFGAVVSHWIG
ncbi:MAG: adenosylcobinamide-GDP ribazoletransferase [Clostridiales bacterium]|nr:adenosylcobinamide-GDP ribazoletransferase [Clostridiales bacterium]